MTRKLMITMACLLMFSTTALAQTDFREALRIAFPATVSVQTDDGGGQAEGRILRRGPGMFMQAFGFSSQRTGFAVGTDLIATQLPSDIDNVTIKTAEGKQFPGEILSRDYVTGLTLIRTEGAEFVSLVVGAGVPEAGLPIVVSRMGATGTAYGASGMIGSGLTRIDSQLGFTQYLNAHVNQSDAGAPIVDATGVVVGIVGESPKGNFLCVPTQPLQRLIDGASDDPSHSKRGLVGIQFVRGDQPLVTEVSEDSPAQIAGIEAGDLVVRVGEFDVARSQDVLAAVAMSRAGDELSIVVKRGDEMIELTVTLKDHPRQEFAQTGAVGGPFAQQAWELRDGKLVPLEGGDPRSPAPMKDWKQGDLEKWLENFRNKDLILPGLPKRLDGIEVARSELEDSLRDQ